MKRTWIVPPVLMLSLVFSLAAGAAQMNLEGFNKRFEFKRGEDGRLESVKMKSMSSGFSITPYLKQVKEDIKSEIERMRNKSAYQAELDEFTAFLEEGQPVTKEVQENIGIVRESIENLPNVNVDAVFEDIKAHGVLLKFEFDLKDALAMLDMSIMAYPNDSRFFYRKNVTYQVVKTALEFAKKKFDSIPVLNLVSFVIVQVHDMVLEQRTFHQNMLLHYLQNFSAQELGLSKKEADLVYSSVYESRISAMNLPESNRAASNWLRYGTNNFYNLLRSCNNKIRRSASSYDEINGRYNYAFVEVVEEGQRVVKNLVDGKHMFSGKASTAYYYGEPNKVKRTRLLLNLGELGLGFLPIPGWIKSQVEGFLESFYVQQRLTEGALAGYFESTGDKAMVKEIKRQMSNPYIILE